MTNTHATRFTEALATRSQPIHAAGARASRFGVAANLGMKLHDADGELSNAADDLLSDHDKNQRAWKKLRTRAEQDGNPVQFSDDSSGRKVLMYGRYLPPKCMKPVYWAVHNNKVDFSAAFGELKELDKVNLANQVLKKYAARSEKDDLKCAALAVSEKGQFYVAMNTQETDTMQYDKECAEANLSTVVKQLSERDDKIKRMYVLGGLLDKNGTLRPDSPLISMCMRCVEKTWAIFAPDALVTAIPMQESAKFMGLDFSKTKSGIAKDVAWQTPYLTLKGPSLIHYAPEALAIAKDAFGKILQGQVDYHSLRYSIVNHHWDGKKTRPKSIRIDERSVLRLLNHDVSIETINNYLVSQAAESIKKGKGIPDNIEYAMVELTDKNGRKRYIAEQELRSEWENAATAPVSTATFHAKISKIDSEHITRIFMMGYTPHSDIYNASCEQWDRAVKRAGGRSEEVPVTFIPLNTGWRAIPTLDMSQFIQVKSLAELSGGGFAGAKQMNNYAEELAAAAHVHGPGCNHR